MWALAAAALWRTKVPADLHLPSLDPSSVFGAHAVLSRAYFPAERVGVVAEAVRDEEKHW